MEKHEQPPFTGTTLKKYKKQLDWRRNKVRDLFSRGYSQYEISNILHMSQSTISRDINHMQTKINQKNMDPNLLLISEYEKTRLILDEALKELWKIIDSPKIDANNKNKSINLIVNIIKQKVAILDKEIYIARITTAND